MNSNSMTNLDAREILLIGSPSAVIAETQLPDKLPIQVCARMTEGTEAAVGKNFSAILVVMSDASANPSHHRRTGLRDGLATLRRNTNAKILLLARMCEEPEAMKLVDAALADDYVICPVRLKKLCEVVHRRPEPPADTTAILERIRRLEKLATEDDLTGLKNRRYILEFARQVIERSKRDNGRVTILLFDIDNFKRYNDIFGHAAGDEVLRQASLLIRRCCRRHDMVARLGGDEFAVVFWDDPQCPPPPAGCERRSLVTGHPREVILIARRFRKELGKADLRLLGSAGKGVLTISGGLAGLGADGSTTDELFAKADKALLDAKRSGKNRIYLVGQPEKDIDKIE